MLFIGCLHLCASNYTEISSHLNKLHFINSTNSPAICTCKLHQSRWEVCIMSHNMHLRAYCEELMVSPFPDEAWLWLQLILLFYVCSSCLCRVFCYASLYSFSHLCRIRNSSLALLFSLAIFCCICVLSIFYIFLYYSLYSSLSPPFSEDSQIVLYHKSECCYCVV